MVLACSAGRGGPRPTMLPRRCGSARGERQPLRSGPTKRPAVKKAGWNRPRSEANELIRLFRMAVGFLPCSSAALRNSGKAACVSRRKSIPAPAELWPPSFKKKPGTIADAYGPQTPGTKTGSWLHAMWQVEVPAMSAKRISSGMAPVACGGGGSPPKQPSPPACASIMPIPRAAAEVMPKSLAAAAHTPPGTRAPTSRTSSAAPMR
mmetsp:Transcript_57162/g.185757  ORF Transcript_57162/g.185757 Transcript_57162/m.185757 type:complete len:207 (-) Transcript_57162:771-1391(-)